MTHARPDHLGSAEWFRTHGTGALASLDTPAQFDAGVVVPGHGPAIASSPKDVAADSWQSVR